jgi:hypothetical protein
MDAADPKQALERIGAMWGRAPYEEVIAALNECAGLLGAEPFMPAIWHWRIDALHTYDRPDEERIKVMEEYLSLGYPLRTRVGPVVLACADRPVLARRYLLPIIAELEAASGTDPVLTRMLTSLRIARDRTLGAPPAL